ncbi:MAG: MFS transporter [Prolixibacteraceae bacterium]|jgi:proton-dependent oligopeptide transporter, POT family|nr:MFS transporter [Prolixibacteraceae bacterium]MBT6005832.1 MFS transporter [Prolixibacteraceae bacterium]MBT6763168.1 MFS transporter [Prolixibacteraceae bacterium]MBT6998958.1 MFS transporter [Prolixibacteraceae bacterium]MBT7393907.1 MFS transporter [Prolixibacteraceae bacterium]
MGFVSVIKKYNATFWASNVIELFERWAWYGFYLAFALYLVNSKDTGALGLSQAQKGIIMGTGSMLLYFLPVITGAIADKVGYKKILFLAFTLYISGFYMIMKFDSFGWMFFAFIWTSVGGAFFKPIISAMIARTTTDETSSIGFGIFYMMINIGGFIGPFIAGVLMQKSWDYVFYMSMVTIGVNYLITFFFFREPVVKDKTSSLIKSILQAFISIGITLKNWKYVLFLIIMILFWTAFNQLYYSFPVFVDQWVDTSTLYDGIYKIWPWLAKSIGTETGTLTAPTLLSMDSFFIIVFQLMVSAFVMRFRPLAAMMGGILVLSGGLALMFSTQSGWIILLGILIFALGEMGSSPKFTEYVGKIAPADQKALYMGTSFLPIAAAHQLAGWLSGDVYEKIADKIYLLQLEVAKRGISLPEISGDFTKNDFVKLASEKLGMETSELNSFLWTTYHPSNIWVVYSGIAVAAVVFLWLYDRFVIGKKLVVR